jgi:hypothetical protein
MEHIESMVGV